MKIYGAGSLEDIEKCTELGVDGILTNPQGFQQYFDGEKTLEEITEAIVKATDLPVFIQIHGGTTEELVARARRLHEISPQVGFKIISDEKGFWAIKKLQEDNINCIATALFTVSQAAVAETVGAFGICPFFSRARDIDMDPIGILKGIKTAYENSPHPPEIIAVSLHGVGDIEEVLSVGVDAIGLRYPSLKEMMTHPLSEKAEILFGENWANVKGEEVDYL